VLMMVGRLPANLAFAYQPQVVSRVLTMRRDSHLP